MRTRPLAVVFDPFAGFLPHEASFTGSNRVLEPVWGKKSPSPTVTYRSLPYHVDPSLPVQNPNPSATPRGHNFVGECEGCA